MSDQTYHPRETHPVPMRLLGGAWVPYANVNLVGGQSYAGGYLDIDLDDLVPGTYYFIPGNATSIGNDDTTITAEGTIVIDPNFRVQIFGPSGVQSTAQLYLVTAT